MQLQPNEHGFALQVTSSAQGTIGAANPCALIGILFSSNATANTVNIWAGTAGSVTGISVVSNLTGAVNSFVRVPGYFARGITYQVPNDAVNLTIFWNPAD